MLTVTTRISPLSLHDALPIWNGDVQAGSTLLEEIVAGRGEGVQRRQDALIAQGNAGLGGESLVYEGRADRKSTRLNSSHVKNSYAVFCLKKKKKTAQ